MNFIRAHLLLTALLSTAFALTARASQAPAPTTAAAASDALELQAGKHDLAELVGRVAKFLACNYLIPSGSDLGTIELQSALRLKRESCQAVLAQLLFTNNLAIVPLQRESGLFEIISLQGPRRSEVVRRPVTMSEREVLENRHSLLFVQTAIELQGMDANVAVNMLRPFFASNGTSTPMGFASSPDGRLLVQGFSDQVAAAIELLGSRGQGDDVDPSAPPPPSLDLKLDTILKRLVALEQRVLQLESRSKADGAQQPDRRQSVQRDRDPN